MQHSLNTFAAPIAPAIGIALLGLGAVLPEYAVDTYFARGGPETVATSAGSLALAGITGANRLLVGAVWPLVIVIAWARSGGTGFRPRRDHRTSLWFLFVAALYAFTIYLKGFIALLDTLFLFLLFAAYLWTVSRHRSRAPLDNSAVRPLSTDTSRPSAFIAGLLICIAAAAAMTSLLSNAAGASALTVGAGLAPMVATFASRLPLLVGVSLLAWTAGKGHVMAALVASQVGLFTVLLGSLPLAFFAHGLFSGDAGSFVLDDRQKSELLLASAQSLLLVVLLLRATVTWRAALALLAPSVLQAALAAFSPGGESTLAQTLPAAVCLGAVVAVISLGRSGARSASGGAGKGARGASTRIQDRGARVVSSPDVLPT